MSNKGFITPLDTGLTEDSIYPNWVKIRPHGNKKQCKELEIKARGLLQKLIDDSKRLGLEHEVNQRRHPQSDGSLIIVHYHYENPVIDIFAPTGKGKKHRASLFQCDLYQDHADTPEDLTTQTITPIYFNVVDIPYWKEIPERQGNMEWKGDFGLVSFDCVQNWGRGILNKKAWNDGLIGPYGEEAGWPYNPRPEHASRAGEITTIVDNYPLNNTELSEIFLYQLNYQAVFEPNNEQVHKQYLFINGTKYSPVFPVSNQVIMGSCVRTLDNGISFCVMVTQVFYTVDEYRGISYEAEDVWYFNLSDGITPTPIKIHTMFYNDPPNAAYNTTKSHITSWAFNADGTIGKALRTQQFFMGSHFTVYGPWSMQRFINLEITYGYNGVTATHTEESSVIPSFVDTVVPGGSELTYEEAVEFVEYHDAWIAEFNVQFGFPVNTSQPSNLYSVLDFKWTENKFFAFGSAHVNLTDQGELSEAQSMIIQDKIYCNSDLIYAYDNTGFTKRVVPSVTVDREDNQSFGGVSMNYVGGDPEHNIAFFIRIAIQKIDPKDPSDKAVHRCITDFEPNRFLWDYPKKISVQLICIFKGVSTSLGSPIIFDVPYMTETEDVYKVEQPCFREQGWSTSMGARSCFQSSISNGYRSVSTYQGTIPSHGATTVGDLGGSIKIAPDGSHCVVSCSYMDIAKYIYPWHRFIHDASVTEIVNRTDDMDKLGVSTELQEAWNKYMINYAIIGSEDTNGETSTRVEQLSRLLFNKKVTEDLIGGASDNHSDYEFGIKEKDTNAFLPIGLYAFPSNEE